MLVVEIKEGLAMRGNNKKDIASFSSVASVGSPSSVSERPFKTLTPFTATAPFNQKGNRVNEGLLG